MNKNNNTLVTIIIMNELINEMNMITTIKLF